MNKYLPAFPDCEEIDVGDQWTRAFEGWPYLISCGTLLGEVEDWFYEDENRFNVTLEVRMTFTLKKTNNGLYFIRKRFVKPHITIKVFLVLLYFYHLNYYMLRLCRWYQLSRTTSYCYIIAI